MHTIVYATVEKNAVQLLNKQQTVKNNFTEKLINKCNYRIYLYTGY